MAPNRIERENPDLTTLLREAAALGRRVTVEGQQWSTKRQFPGRIVIDSWAGALQTSSELGQRDTLWTDGSRIEGGEVGAACVWQSPASGGWTGRRFYLGMNKEVFDAETFAIYQALRVVDRRQESGHCYTIFVDSTAAIDRVRTDALGPGQRFAIAAMGACDRALARDNEVTVRWVPAHSSMEGNEQVDITPGQQRVEQSRTATRYQTGF